MCRVVEPPKSDNIGVGTVIDLRFKQVSRAAAFGWAWTFPWALLLQPIVWLGRKLSRAPTWEIIIAGAHGDEAIEFRRLSEGRVKRQELLAAGAALAVSRKGWLPSMVLIPVVGFVAVSPAAAAVIGVGAGIGIGASVAALVGALGGSILLGLPRSEAVDRDEFRLQLFALLPLPVALALPLLGGEFLSGALPALGSIVLISRGMRSLVRVRCARSGVASPRMEALTW